MCGKLAIVRSILAAERNSRLYFDKHKGNFNIVLHKLGKTWYPAFFRLLTRNHTKDGLADRFRSVLLCVFNYDRCIEHFLYHALQVYYGMSSEAAAGLMKQLPIYHPYGSVGSLPWQGGDDVMAFGDEPSPHQLLQLADGIKTFTEGVKPGSGGIWESKRDIARAVQFSWRKSALCRPGDRRSQGGLNSPGDIAAARKLVFLGFGFHELNMELLSLTDGDLEVFKKDLEKGYIDKNLFPSCFATAHGHSESNVANIKGRIRRLFGNQSATVDQEVKDSSCRDFFQEFSMSLSF
uniref:Uncharacterized protein n=1 Tax=Candidatus Kentrum sp. FM TaxID=2126340 RepID=A0A450U0G5_9GAMM|nr:MAG: hypothetical protein BECKFM1743C_GA0114222_108732 [Candidatus Kentron sp. FM]VFK22220.1 MAG: hypothetical protein BECKFM1743B_GA0114221_108452 [Candidatus Kentron sp. FM]